MPNTISLSRPWLPIGTPRAIFSPGRKLQHEGQEFRITDADEGVQLAQRLASYAEGLLRQAQAEEWAVIHAGEKWLALAPILKTLIEVAGSLVRKGRESGDPVERRWADRIEFQLQQLGRVALGEALMDREDARATFLLNFRELLVKHRGKYVLITRGAKQGQWEIGAIAPTVHELVKLAEGQGMARGSFFVEWIIEGAETVGILDIMRPEAMNNV